MYKNKRHKTDLDEKFGENYETIPGDAGGDDGDEG